MHTSNVIQEFASRGKLHYFFRSPIDRVGKVLKGMFLIAFVKLTAVTKYKYCTYIS